MKEWRVPTLYFNCEALRAEPVVASRWIRVLAGSAAAHRKALHQWREPGSPTSPRRLATAPIPRAYARRRQFAPERSTCKTGGAQQQALDRVAESLAEIVEQLGVGRRRRSTGKNAPQVEPAGRFLCARHGCTPVGGSRRAPITASEPKRNRVNNGNHVAAIISGWR